MFEIGASAFIPRTGPFAWHGFFIYWIPLVIFGIWILATSIMLLAALKPQEQAGLGNID
ncbi:MULTISPECIES: hypothetical protein [Sphingobium]|uniref:hypothetical protein n=1 Tax=Sphingobium sp. MI1205 TaxID=407020 RepID=UPI000A7F42D4|nr:hypothetical protein [Sphingobium sp. MI1205]